jgi:hypothetical protein
VSVRIVLSEGMVEASDKNEGEAGGCVDSGERQRPYNARLLPRHLPLLHVNLTLVQLVACHQSRPKLVPEFGSAQDEYVEPGELILASAEIQRIRGKVCDPGSGCWEGEQ